MQEIIAQLPAAERVLHQVVQFVTAGARAEHHPERLERLGGERPAARQLDLDCRQMLGDPPGLGNVLRVALVLAATAG